MTSQYSHIFDDWDRHGPDISMVDLGESGIEHDLSDRQTLNHARNSSYHDDASGRSLLRAESSATRTTTTDYEPSTPSSIQKDVRSPSFQDSEVLNSPKGPRQRFPGISNNFPRLWHKKSAASQRTTSTFDGHFAHGKPGWWKKQMLVDRSLRSMAAFTALCAVIMWIIVFSYLKDFIRRPNLNSTSVGDPKGESCETMEQRNVAVHFFINIAATMVLGCSNTYQQLVTSLKVSEMRWVLSKRGDSRVGTNSPWAINHKQTGKTKAWAAWLLLISTSIPVHFLANSVVGPSFYISMPTNVNYSPGPANATSVVTYPSGYSYSTNIYTENTQRYDSACWTAFRAGTYVLPQNLDQLAYDWNVDKLGNSTSYSTVNVQFMTQNCTEYVNSTDWQSALGEVVYDNDLPRGDIYGMTYTIGSCTLGQSVMCTIQDPKDKECRLNVRMQAAFTLAGCLLIKAAYMIILNYRARGKVKEQCLTYGDVIVASVLDPELKIHNECLLNSGDGYRHAVQHTCHKHCKDPVPSTTGDGIGHCQKCKKFNVTNMAADLPHPSIAIKYKRSLLSNLGSTAVTQMIILMICSLCMISVSLMLAVIMGSAASDIHSMCREGREDAVFSDYGIQCSQGAHTYLKRQFGTWGGFSSSASLGGLSPDSLGSEFTAFAISNGAQFLYSLLYLLLIYNLTLISMEHEWGSWETKRRKPRCTIVRGRPFEQSYFLQLPSRILLPMMAFAASMHWLLGEAISTIESIYVDPVQSHHIEHSIYFVTYASYPIWLSTILMVAMTAVCWWAFTFTREGFIPQMYGSIRTVCASTTELTDFGPKGILWGDLGMGLKFRHAGFSAEEPEKIVPAELYCGKGERTAQ